MAEISLAGELVLIDIDNKTEALICNRLTSFVWPSLKRVDPQTNPFVESDYEDSRFALPFGDYPEPRVNEFIDPLGLSRYFRGLVLVDQKAMERVAQIAFGFSGSIESGTPASWGANSRGVPLKIDYGPDAITRTVYLLPPLAIDAAERNKLFVVPLVDKRFRLLKETGYYTHAIPKKKTWQQVVTELVKGTGINLTLPSVDPKLSVPDERAFSNSHVPITVALDAILISLGLRAKMLPTETVLIETATQAASSIDAAAGDDCKFGGRSPRVVIASKLDVTIPVAVNYYECESTREEGVIAGGSDSVLPYTVHTSHCLHRVDGSELSGCRESLEQLKIGIGEIYSDWSTHSRPQFLISPGVHDWHSTYFDYTSVHASGANSLRTSAITTPNDFGPRVNFSQWIHHYIHVPGGSDWVFQSPNEGVPAREGIQPGKTICKAFYIEPDNEELAPVVDICGDEIECVPVWNLSEVAIPRGKYFLADTVDKKPIASMPQSTEYVIFEINPTGYYADANDYDYCIDRKEDAPVSVSAKVLRRPCGKSRVHGEDANENIVVYDELESFLFGREREDIAGKIGVAILMAKTEEEKAADAATTSTLTNDCKVISLDTITDDPDCKWVITWIDWFRERVTVTDLINTGESLLIKREIHKVWDHCLLPDEEMGATCPEDYYG